MPMERVNVAMEILRMAAEQDVIIPDAVRLAAEDVVLKFLTGPKTDEERDADAFEAMDARVIRVSNINTP